MIKIYFLLATLSTSVYARQLESTIRSFNSRFTSLAALIAVAFIVWSSLSFMKGEQAGKEKLQSSVVGTAILLAAGAIVDWLRSTIG